MLQSFSQVVVLASFYAKRDYIAKNLCENRDKPMLHCNGKCCLKKRLAKDSKENAPSSSKNNKAEQVVYCCVAHMPFSTKQFFESILAPKYAEYNNSYISSFHYSVFHPPTA